MRDATSLNPTRIAALWLTAAAALAAAAHHAGAVEVRDICRLKGSEHNKLIGMGLVVGLPGTGDGGNFTPSLRALAQVIAHLAADPTVFAAELRDTRNVAMVYLSAELPDEGVAEGDRVDVVVAAAGPAKSLAGGTLLMVPMTGPLPNSPQFAFAEGLLSVPDPTAPTVGVVRRGAQMIRDVRTVAMDEFFRVRLVVGEQHAGWPTANAIASQINGVISPDGPRLAKAVDAKNILIDVPIPERDSPSQFINDVMTTFLDMSFVSGPAKVVINERAGTIVISGDVSLSPVIISHGGLTITTLQPPPQGTVFDPIETRSDFVAMDPAGRAGPELADLLAAFNQLKVPAKDRIQIIKTMHDSGKLHAELVLEE